MAFRNFAKVSQLPSSSVEVDWKESLKLFLNSRKGFLFLLKLINLDVEQKAGEGSDAGLHGLALKVYADGWKGTDLGNLCNELLERGNQAMLEPPYPPSGAHKKVIEDRIAELERELG